MTESFLKIFMKEQNLISMQKGNLSININLGEKKKLSFN
jgi:hypothetical protein